jgi:hypothetical protein
MEFNLGLKGLNNYVVRASIAVPKTAALGADGNVEKSIPF